MNHKLVGFSNPVTSGFINEQLQVLASKISGLEIELADGTDIRLKKYTKNPNRLPCYILFQNNIHKNHIHAKMSEDYATRWVLGAIG
jgi:hypothetical protein|tara:strand:- start:1267 stop:1527 length:261 start_codon:yes stop_codon:yes gene_type:complete